jgi:CO/xanthine dehydrogenase Mo-binding subunit
MTAVGRSIPKLENREKVLGRAEYIDDLYRAGMLHAAILGSPHAHAKILSYDVSEAMAAPGVVAVLTGDDVPADGRMGAFIKDEHAIANAGALAADVERCMETLSDQQRAVLRADLAHGGIAPAGMLAAALHTTRSAIYVARHFGRRALRDALRRCGHAFGVRDRLGEPTRPHS